MNVRVFCWTCLLTATFPLNALFAQERFELVAPALGAASTAILDDSILEVISSEGAVSVYRREPRLDSADGSWLAYYDRGGRQVIRWPRNSSGRFQIGSVQGSSVTYRESQMEIRPVAPPPQQIRQRPVVPEPGRLPQDNNGLVLPPAMSSDGRFDRTSEGVEQWPELGEDYSASSLFQAVDSQQLEDQTAQLLMLAAAGEGRELQVLARDERSGFRGMPLASDPSAAWWVAPAGRGYVRIETYSRGRVFAVSTTRSRGLALEALAQDSRQLWRVRGGARSRSGYLLESAFFPGWCLTMSGVGVALQPIAFVPQQLWMPLIAPPPPNFDPFWKSVSREVHVNPPLEPAQLQLVNSHRNALFVLLGDARPGAGAAQHRIEAGGSVVLTLDRDPGATLVETVEIRSAAGVWDRQQLVTPIPPAAYYDLSVYEEFLQSIAIDRTGKSPNPIEDVNYMPKSIGWLPLPAGTALPRTSSMDVYRQAKEASNPGAVRRMDLKQFDEPEGLTPAEELLKEFQSTPKRSF